MSLTQESLVKSRLILRVLLLGGVMISSKQGCPHEHGFRCGSLCADAASSSRGTQKKVLNKDETQLNNAALSYSISKLKGYYSMHGCMNQRKSFLSACYTRMCIHIQNIQQHHRLGMGIYKCTITITPLC